MIAAQPVSRPRTERARVQSRQSAGRGLALSLLLLLPLAATGCSGLNETEQRVLSGGAIGAGVGTVGTALTGGCIACGAAIGGAVGAGVGYLSDKVKFED